MLHAHLNSTEEQFCREAQFLEKLRHPHVLPILDIGFAEAFGYLIAEYAANGSLRQLLRRQPSRPLPIEQAVSIVMQVGQALDYAHQQNIIHRDLKPENVLFTAQGNALLADFGIAVVLATASMKLIDNVGTPYFISMGFLHTFELDSKRATERSANGDGGRMRAGGHYACQWLC